MSTWIAAVTFGPTLYAYHVALIENKQIKKIHLSNEWKLCYQNYILNFVYSAFIFMTIKFTAFFILSTWFPVVFTLFVKARVKKQ